ncbi:AlbA family DNA-binding domain-containing protein [Sinorhizobium meliloti]|uniref:AlbA family DNA-binding domain-containing protein n=1 Tax=Rhizobium meliloti TaxID=382 RepID=UPI003F165230
MSVFKPILEEVVEADVLQLIADGQHEGRNIEFKRDMYGNADADKKEFLKDLSSFSNSAGGLLIIGIDEAQGIAAAVAPIAGNSDAALQRLEQIARTGIEPRVVGIQMRAVPIAAGGFVYIVRVPRSWNPPHRVSYQNTNRFYLRSSAGAHEASVEELRAVFSNGADMREKMAAYINERTHKVGENAGVVPLAHGPGLEGRLVLHVLPFAAFAGGAQIDVSEAQNLSNLLQPIASTGNRRINFDGFMVVRNGVPHGYTQVFRNGIVEATKVRITAEHPHGWRIPMRSFLEPIFERLPSYIRALQALDVPPPFGVSISLIEVEGSFLGANNNALGFEDQNAIDRPTLILPMQTISDFGSDASYRAAITPALHALFNAVGLANGEEFLANFNQDGAWIGL